MNKWMARVLAVILLCDICLRSRVWSWWYHQPIRYMDFSKANYDILFRIFRDGPEEVLRKLEEERITKA